MQRVLWVLVVLVAAEAALGAPAFAARDYTAERVTYARPNGKRLTMTLFVPRAGGQTLRPAVVLIHGGAWVFGTRRQLHWYGRRLAEKGYVAASINYRLMPWHGFPACLHDSKAAVRWLRIHATHYGVDPGRIAVLGNSAGGHLTALLATTRPADGLEGGENPGPSSAVQAAVNLYGVADMSYYRHPRGYIRLFGLTARFADRFVGGKREDDGQNPYDLASPTYYAHPNTCPMLFVHGTKDNQVPYGQSVAFCEQLRRLGVPTRLITVPYGHAFDFLHHRTRGYVFTEILGFLQEHLGESFVPGPTGSVCRE